jgi:hypothetical protein
MEKIPFSVYDFFAYLSSGVVWLLTADYILRLGLLQKDSVSPVLAVALILFSYVCGHIVAHFSSFIFEHFAVGRILKRPNVILLGEKPHWIVFAWVCPNYFRALPKHTQERVVAQAESRGAKGTGEALFLHAYPVVSAVSSVQSRLDDFRNQYGFARNMSFAFVTSAIALLIAHFVSPHPVRLRWALLSGFTGIVLFYRYLKFFRQYSYELFLRYAELPRP